MRVGVGSTSVVRAEASLVSEHIGPLAWLLWSVFLRSRSAQSMVRYKLETLQAKVPQWLAKRRWGKKDANPPSIRTVSRSLRKLEEFGLVVRTGRTFRGCAIRRVYGFLAPGDAGGILVPVETARMLGMEVVEPMVDTHAALDPAPMQYAEGIEPHPLFGRLLLKQREDLHFPDLPYFDDGILDYTPPPYPKVGREKPFAIVKLMISAYQGVANYHTNEPCDLYAHGMSRGENTCAQASARILRKLDIPPHQWALYWSRVLMNVAKDPWIPTEEKPPKISKIFNPTVLKKHGEAARDVELVLPWVRAPDAYKLVETLDRAREQAKLAMHYERITQEDLDRAAKRVKMEVDKLTESVKQWNCARYAQDNHRIQQGDWVWG